MDDRILRLERLLSVLGEHLDADQKREVGGLLVQFCHDLNSPLATWTIELFAVHRIAARMVAAGGERAHTAEGLSDIHENLQMACDGMTALVRAVDARARDWNPEGR